MPSATFIMIEAHVDVLRIVGSDVNFVFCSQLLQIRLVLRNGGEFLGGLMGSGNSGGNLFLAHRTIIHHDVLEVTHAFQQVNEHLWISIFQLLCRHDIRIVVARTYGSIAIQTREVLALVLLGISTSFLDNRHQLVVSLLVGLRILHEVFQQSHRLGHVLTQTVEGDGDVFSTHIDVPVTAQLIELLLEVNGRQLVGTQILQVVGSDVVAVVGTLTKLIAVGQREQAVGVVLHIVKRQTLLGLRDGHVFLEVHELRLYRIHLRVLDILHKLTHLVAVGGDRCDSRLVNLLLQRVNTLCLVNGHVAVGEEVIGEINDFLFGNLRDSVDKSHFILPVLIVDESIDIHVGTSAVAFQQSVVGTFLVVDNAGQQVVREVTLLQLFDLTKHQLLHLVERLTLFRSAHQEEGSVVVQKFGTAIGRLYLHGLVQVEVEETGTSVAQHVFHQLQRVGLCLICLFGTPSHPDCLSLLTNDGRILRLGQRG